jgi:hypothetical protein
LIDEVRELQVGGDGMSAAIAASLSSDSIASTSNAPVSSAAASATMLSALARLKASGPQRGWLRESKNENLSRSQLYLKTFVFAPDGIASH